MTDADIGRVPAEPGSHEPSPAVSAASGFDPSRNLKAFYFEMTVRALEEMMDKERSAMKAKIAQAADLAESDALFVYADNVLHDAHQRAVRIATLSGIHNMMAPNIRDSDGSAERQDAEERLGPKDDSAGRKASPTQPIDIPSEPQP